MRGLRRISTPAALHQFVLLWHKIQTVQLTHEPDQIRWRFTADGVYSSHSAYNMQFTGSHPDYNWESIWKFKVENKCKFFLWLLLQFKLLTADRILKRGGHMNPICQLCRTRRETITHMAANCSYSKEVWAHMERLTGQQNLRSLTPIRNLKTRWTNLMGTTKERSQIATCAIWNVWKERCRRVYDNKSCTPLQVVSMITHDVAMLQVAHAYQE